MKKKLIILICLAVSIVAFGQNEKPKFIDPTDRMISLKADESDLINNYLANNIVCPQQAAECCKEGTEVIQFTVTPTGDVTEFKVINSVCPELDKEVIRVLLNTNGMWEPVRQNGQPVAAPNEVVFMFGGQNNETIVNYFVAAATRNYKTGSKLLFAKNKPGKALRYFDKGINYMPNDKALLALRGLCRYEMGYTENNVEYTESAQRDWNRIITLGGLNSHEVENNWAGLKGFQEMTEMLSLR